MSFGILVRLLHDDLDVTGLKHGNHFWLHSFDPLYISYCRNLTHWGAFFVLKGGYNTWPVKGPFKAYVVLGCICELGVVLVVILIFLATGYSSLIL